MCAPGRGDYYTPRLPSPPPPRTLSVVTVTASTSATVSCTTVKRSVSCALGYQCRDADSLLSSGTYIPWPPPGAQTLAHALQPTTCFSLVTQMRLQSSLLMTPVGRIASGWPVFCRLCQTFPYKPMVMQSTLVASYTTQL